MSAGLSFYCASFVPVCRMSDSGKVLSPPCLPMDCIGTRWAWHMLDAGTGFLGSTEQRPRGQGPPSHPPLTGEGYRSTPAASGSAIGTHCTCGHRVVENTLCLHNRFILECGTSHTQRFHQTVHKCASPSLPNPLIFALVRITTWL